MERPKSSQAVSSQVYSAQSVVWLWLSIAGGLLAIAGSLVGLADSQIYAGLTKVFLPQAIAQDIANLAIASPALIILAVLALRGSLGAYLLWLGVLVFTFYNYVIYTFSVPFGPLFLLWVAVLGISVYAMIGGVASLHHEGVKRRFPNQRVITIVAWALMVVAFLFGLLWLSEDVPALFAGSTPQSLIDMGIPTNPVHILDLAFFLPAAILTGILLLKGVPLGYSLAPAFLVFLLLTGVPILITPAVQANLGEQADWGVAVPIGTLTVILLGILIWLMSSLRRGE